MWCGFIPRPPFVALYFFFGYGRIALYVFSKCDCGRAQHVLGGKAASLR